MTPEEAATKAVEQVTEKVFDWQLWATTLAAVVLGFALTPAYEWWKHKRQVEALRADLRELLLSSVGVIASKKALVATCDFALKGGGTPSGFHVPFPRDLVERILLALGNDLPVRDWFLLSNIFERVAVADDAIEAGLCAGNELGLRQAALAKLSHAPRAIALAETLLARYLRGDVADITNRDDTATKYPT